MEKKSYINPNVPSLTNGEGTYIFLYWDDQEPIDPVLEELILFNSINDTHRPEDHILWRKAGDMTWDLKR